MKQLLTSRDAEEAKKISTVKVNVFIKGIKKDTKYCEKCRISSNNRKKTLQKEVFFSYSNRSSNSSSSSSLRRLISSDFAFC